MSKPYLYLFIDEGGNFDFSQKGTRYFTLTSVMSIRPFLWEADLAAIKYDLLETGTSQEYFHATEDLQATRDRVFAVIASHLVAITIDSVIVEKAKTVQAWQAEERIYPEMLGYLLSYIIAKTQMTTYAGVIVMTDAIPVKKKRQILEKAVKETLARKLPQEVSYHIVHHDSKSCLGLQIADYCNWAIYRKWDKSDTRSYGQIQAAIRSEFDIFRRGKTRYY